MPPRRRVVERVTLQVPAPFDYERATSVEHAIALLEELGPGARLLAGGHSLLPMMKLRLAVPDHVIDIDPLADELGYVREQSGEVRTLAAAGGEITSAEAQAALAGEAPSEELFARAAALAAESCDPVSDQRASAEYKRHVAGMLTERVLRRATARALGEHS